MRTRRRCRTESRIHLGSISTEDRADHLVFAVAVDTFVEPWLFKLIGGDHPVPILVAILVGDGCFHAVVASRRLPPIHSADDHRRIFHFGRRRVWLGIDQGDFLVGIGSRPIIELLHALFQDGEIAIPLISVRCKDQRVKLDRAKTVEEGIVGGLKMG